MIDNQVPIKIAKEKIIKLIVIEENCEPMWDRKEIE